MLHACKASILPQITSLNRKVGILRDRIKIQRMERFVTEHINLLNLAMTYCIQTSCRTLYIIYVQFLFYVFAVIFFCFIVIVVD